MLGVFSLNAYIGLKDSVLSKLQPAHQGGNFIIATVDIVSAAFLLYYGQGKRIWVLLAGVVWPMVYLFALWADVESRLCLFTGLNCFTNVQVSFEYLILGSANQGWRLWPLTMLTVILLLSATLALSLIYLLTGTSYKRRSEVLGIN